MMLSPVARTHAHDLRRSTLWWAVAVAAVSGLVAIAFSTIAGDTELDESMAELPDAVQALIGGLDGVSYTSPAGYLHGQLFANLLPVLLTVLAVGLGARAVGGAESDGHLQLIASHPVARTRLALDRAGVALAAVSTVAVAGVLAVLAAGPAAGLFDDGPQEMAVVSAGAGAWALAVLHGAVAFGVGAATGSRVAATVSAAAVAVGGFVAQSIAALGGAVEAVGIASPWQWFTDSSPLVHGAAAVVLPLVASLALAAATAVAGVRRFQRRDLR